MGGQQQLKDSRSHCRCRSHGEAQRNERAPDEAWFNGDQFCDVRQKWEELKGPVQTMAGHGLATKKDITIVCSCTCLVYVTYTGGVYMYMHLYVQLHIHVKTYMNTCMLAHTGGIVIPHQKCLQV